MISKIKTTWVNTALLLFFLIDYMKLFGRIPLLGANIAYLALGAVSIFYTVARKGLKSQLPVFSFIFVYTFFGVLGIAINGNLDIQELLWPIAFFGMSLLLLNFKVEVRIAKLMYYFTLIIMSIHIVLAGSVNSINTTTSRNSISVLVLMYFSIYLIALYTNNKKISIFPVFWGLFISTLAIGRSGILSFLILIILFYIFDFNGEKHKIRKLSKWILPIIILVFLSVMFQYFFGTYIYNMIENFQKRGLNSVRIMIWRDYFQKTISSPLNFCFGSAINGTYWLDLYKENLHNSFLMLHAKYGIVIFVTTLFLIIRAIYRFIKYRNYLYFTLLIVLLFRMQFDYTNFNAQLDVILFYFLFIRYYDVRKQKIKTTIRMEERTNNV